MNFLAFVGLLSNPNAVEFLPLAGWLFFLCAVVHCIFIKITMVWTHHIGMNLDHRLTFHMISGSIGICGKCVNSFEPYSDFQWEKWFHVWSLLGISLIFPLGLDQLMELLLLHEGKCPDKRRNILPIIMVLPNIESLHLSFRDSRCPTSSLFPVDFIW